MDFAERVDSILNYGTPEKPQKSVQVESKTEMESPNEARLLSLVDVTVCLKRMGNVPLGKTGMAEASSSAFRTPR